MVNGALKQIQHLYLLIIKDSDKIKGFIGIENNKI